MNSGTKQRQSKHFIVFTEFASAKHTQGEPRIVPLEEFAKEAARSYKDKKAQPLCVPDQLPDHTRIKGVEPISATSVFLDFDKPELSPVDAAVRLDALGAAYVIYCTFSWTKEKPKYRIVLPLAAPMELETRRHLIAKIGQIIPGIAPESTTNKRGYFVGRNGRKSPEPVWKTGKTAEQVVWPDAPAPPAEAHERQISLKDNPARMAQDRFAELGRKLRDGDGRWACVEYLATRVSARAYDADTCLTFLNSMIGKYFDARDVHDEERKRWESRIVHWQKKDYAKQKQRLKHNERIPPKMPDNLPSTFSLNALLEMNLPPTEWIVEGLLPPGLAMLAGPPKVGKSQVALDLAMAIAGGTRFLNHWPTRKSKVIYYDLESGHHLLLERVKPLMIARHHTSEMGQNVSFSLITDQGSNAIAQLRADLEAEPDVKLMVVDIFARMRDLGAEASKRVSSYLLEYEVISQFQDICMEYPKLCILLVHHTNKRSSLQSDHWQDSISGTQGIVGGTHTNLLLERPSKQGLSEEDRELLRRYAILHMAGKRVSDNSVTLMQTGDGCTWAISDKSPEQVKAGSLQKDVLALLESDDIRLWCSTEVAADLGKRPNTVKEVMRRMARQRMIVSPTGKGYCLPQDEAKEKTRRPHVGRPAKAKS